MSAPIALTDLMPVAQPAAFKLHLACGNDDGVHPLDEYVADRERWLDWNSWRGSRNDWTREFIFSFIEYYPVANAHLFGGVFRVLQRLQDRYVIEEVDIYSKWEGRVVCRFVRYQGMRGRAFLLENHLKGFEVLQVLPERYDGERFCGYENVNHNFSSLRNILLREKPDWKAALMAVKGVYLIVDAANGKKYVGSAYGGAGIWSRLSCYLQTGHGWNDQLICTIADKGLDYAVANFRFSILEVFTFTTADELILQRESHWKRVLLSREFGYNYN